MENQDRVSMCRHSLSHILAKAVCELYEGAKLAIGPAIDNGFYYDFDLPKSITADDFDTITAKMQEILKRGEDFVCREVSVAEAKEIFADQPYKLELIDGLADEKITLYYTGDDFVDLCRGPHVENAKELRSFAFKIASATGAYWRGDSTRPMLQRVYVYAFPSKQELKEYITKTEEAKKRDHNKLGRELEYFTTVESIGQGLPILLPKGAKVIQTLQRFVEDEEARRGYVMTMTPLMAKRDLYRISGHWDHYLDGMFVLGDPHDETKECFALRPMTCSFQYQAYLNRPRSYRDLPLRYGETSTLFRNEDSGEMHGLIRVRQFTISEGHLVLRPDQLEEEFRGCLDLAMYMLDAVGLREDCTFRFSQWDPARTDKYEGTPEQWDEAQRIMGQILDNIGLDYEIGIDEAAFYGPKLDIQCKNVFGKEDTIITIQI
ncbi:MAG: threonine--tRNA ligase, partial [Clostridia bacterium]|nr:threonine--tRNA ligase [Clostridia bacterium]